MGLPRHALPTLERPATPSNWWSDWRDPGGERKLEIVVVYTSPQATAAALKMAGCLGSRLNAHVTLMAPQVVSYSLPLERPPVAIEFTERRLRELAVQSPVDTAVRLCLCRDRLPMLTAALRPHSLVVVGGRKRWWPTQEQRLAGELRRAGHAVIVAETE
jgi:hypothetical protein